MLAFAFRRDGAVMRLDQVLDQRQAQPAAAALALAGLYWAQLISMM
ncbi:MAG: hypothetical protein JWQ01_3012 [Massilia sp.]|nr:hypothetical protein [Massilia sp.]